MMDQHDRIAEVAPWIDYQWEILCITFLVVGIFLCLGVYLSEDD